MKKSLWIWACFFMLTFSLFGAGKWEESLILGVNINQVSFTNWKKGGQNTFSWTTRLDGQLSYKDSLNQFDNNLKIVFGQTQTNSDPFKKSVDEIRMESVFAKKIGLWVDPYVSLKLETQIAPGFKYSETEGDRIVSKFFDPGYITESVGFGVNPLPPFKLRLGFALKQTVTFRYNSPYADDPKTTKTEKIKNEKGLQLAIDVNWKMNDNLVYKSNTAVFSDLEWIKAVDLKIDNILIAKINKLFNVSFEYNILYDLDQSRQFQLRQALTLGVNFTIL